MKKVVITQSNYIPWKGYFDLIASADELIVYDNMQYTRRDWRNRNKIKTPQGLQWLTVPVVSKGNYHQIIRDTKINGSDWSLSHWKSLEINYARSKFFEHIAEWLQPIYCEKEYTYLSELNRCLMARICNYLDIQTRISCSWDYQLVSGKTEKLVDLCIQSGASEYISGPAAKEYVDEEVFREKNIKLTWFDYSGYSVYPQLWGDFEHGVSILDLLFNCGQESHMYLKSMP